MDENPYKSPLSFDTSDTPKRRPILGTVFIVLSIPWVTGTIWAGYVTIDYAEAYWSGRPLSILAGQFLVFLLMAILSGVTLFFSVECFRKPRLSAKDADSPPRTE